ncbi:protein DPCD [Epargyreus clarus]|uniref:protein DPCD n=1 Tax=Epargyreus clarus TaxID=520877 RepID=UPI003C2E238D
MKRKSCLIEAFDAKKVGAEAKNKVYLCGSASEEKMYKNTIWYKSLLDAEKTCLKDDKIKKFHYKFEDGREMVEEYNLDTQVMLRRSWKVKGKLGGEGKWTVEVGDPIPDATPNNDPVIIECKDQPVVTRRNTRINLEWRIRNMPYPIETYSIKANDDEKCVVVSTTNKKYFKKLYIPELVRLGLPVEQANVYSTHNFNTLVVVYKKPQQLLDMEKEWFVELQKVKPIKDIPSDCKTQ